MKNLFSLFTFIIIPFGLFAQISSSGLIVHHDFNDNGTDNSGNGNNIYLNNNTVLTTGLCNEPLGAVTCPNEDDNAVLSSSTVLGSTFSVSVWFKLSEDKYAQTIVGNYVACQSQNTGFSLLYYGSPAQNTPRLRFFYGQNNFEYRENLVDNQWHHAVLVVNNGTYYCYLDNTLVSTKNHTASHSTNTIYIGNSDKTAPGCGNYNSMNCTGAVDELRIYNTALSANDISEIYTRTCSDIILCSSYSGNTLDESGNELHGTVKNDALLTDGTDGEVNGSYTFPNSLSHIDYGDSIPFPTVFTTSVWFKLSEDRYVQNIVGNHIHCSYEDKGFSLIYYGSPAQNNPRLRIQVGLTNYEEDIDLIDNEWHQAVITFSLNTYTLFLDGIPVGSKAGSYNNTSEHFFVGYQELDSPGCGYGNTTNTTGAIDNLKIQAGILSNEEILNSFNEQIVLFNEDQTSDLEEISIFPNPSKGEINVSGLNAAEYNTYNIVNSEGVSVQAGEIKMDTIKINSLQPGAYHVILNNSKGHVSNQTIIVE